MSRGIPADPAVKAEALRLMREGATNSEVAAAITLSDGTVHGWRARFIAAGDLPPCDLSPQEAKARANERIQAGARKGGETRAAQLRAKGQWFWPAKLPPISEAEAQRLIAEAIAAGRVTVCPPAASVERPINAGAGW